MLTDIQKDWQITFTIQNYQFPRVCVMCIDLITCAKLLLWYIRQQLSALVTSVVSKWCPGWLFRILACSPPPQKISLDINLETWKTRRSIFFFLVISKAAISNGTGLHIEALINILHNRTSRRFQSSNTRNNNSNNNNNCHYLKR